MIRCALLVWLTVAAGLFGTWVSATAAEIQWNGGFSQFWHNEFNWDPFGGPTFFSRRVPGDIDTASLLSPAGDDVFLGGDTAPINGLTVSNGIELFTDGFLLEVDNEGSAIASIAGGARLHVESRTGGGNAFETDNLFLTGGGALNLDGGNALVEGNSTIFGNSRINGTDGDTIHFGGDVSLIDHSVLRMLGRATATFSPGAKVSAESSSIIDLAQTVNVNNGIYFEITTSARMEVIRLNIGNDGAGNGSDGTFLLDQGGGSGLLPRVDVSQDLTIGDDSTGTALMHVKDAHASIVGTTTIYATGTLLLEGSQLGANDTVLVDGGAITATGRDDPIFLFEGDALQAINGGLVSIEGSQDIRADGKFEFLSSADFAVTETLRVGTDPVGAGELIVHGSGSTAVIGDDLLIGNAGFTGMATFLHGAMVTAKRIEAGASGAGMLRIESGAVVASTSGRIGSDAGVSGSATVTGAGSMWTNATTLAVGSSGNGQLTIESGGGVASAVGFLGADSNSTGTVTVTGTGSNWRIAGNLSVGGGTFGDLGGAGTVHILSGGLVSVGNEVTLYSNGDLNLSGGTLITPTFDFQGGQFQWTAGTLHVETYPRNLVNQGGKLAPGAPQPEAWSVGGTTVVGDYTQQSGAVLEIEIGGNLPVSEYDQASITGVAVLGGELQLSLIDGFAPSAGDSFTVLSALGGIAGVFSNVASGQRLESIDGTGSFKVHYGPGSAFSQNQVLLTEFEQIATSIQGAHLFCNNSSFDGNGSTVDAADFDAIVTDKIPLGFGETAEFVNISGYSRGINGVFIDIDGLPADGAQVDASDFAFRIGNDDSPDDWTAAPAPASVGVLADQGDGGADRVYVTFADGVIAGSWLRVTVKANADTGLAADEDFFFGSAPGETGAGFLPGITGVDAADLQSIAQNLTPLPDSGTELITEPNDLNRDGTVNAFDLQVVAVNLDPNVIQLITPVGGAARATGLTAVPEPSAFLLLTVCGLVGWAGFRRP